MNDENRINFIIENTKKLIVVHSGRLKSISFCIFKILRSLNKEINNIDHLNHEIKSWESGIVNDKNINKTIRIDELKIRLKSSTLNYNYTLERLRNALNEKLIDDIVWILINR